ncbi:hypothetical protein B7494_g3901 [Chlorociboria aeruginascens]|nr:hypothetical protein B7494_g3901 [Chlorociboria aeruginascens]
MMANINDVNTVSSGSVADSADSSEGAIKVAHTTPNGVGGEADLAAEGFQLTVILPHKLRKVQLFVSPQDAIHDIRQSIIELPGNAQYSCFHLEHQGERINDFIQVSEVKGLTAESELHLVEDPYTEKEARLHVIRVRELIGAAGDRTDTLHGILSGMSLHDFVVAGKPASSEISPTQGAVTTGYDFQAPGILSNLLPQIQEHAPKTVKSISVSPWNPPPYHLRQKGHLLYLQVTTNEGEQYQITSHVSGFFVNRSSNSRFDPFPRTIPKSNSAHSLLTLIDDLSASFGSSFMKLQEFNNAKELLATFQITNANPASPWIVPAPSSSLITHHSDITRTQESYLISAAARGAVLVAKGEVAPLNPTETKDAQIFVYNNIFYSFGADGVGTFASEGGDEAARIAAGKDVMGIRMVNQMDIEGLFTPGTVVVEYLGRRIVCQSIVPGIFKQRDPEENQIDYGAVDGRDVIAADERFVPVFEKLAKALKVKKHPVWDKAGKRYELEGSVEMKGLMGTDGRKYVLDLYRITPLDIIWMEECGTAISTPKQNSDASKNPYPHRMTVLRIELVESYWKSKMREWVNSELERKRKIQKENSTKQVVGSSREHETTDAAISTVEKRLDENEDDSIIDTSEESTKTADLENERIDIAGFSFALNPDAFSGQEPQNDAEKEDWIRDEKEVMLACEFLRKTVIPELIHDLKEGDVGFPMDGQSLSQLLHKRGINIRYLGALVTLAEGKKLEALRVLVVQEMISRAFKHIAGKYLRYLPIPLSGACISHLLNCLLGSGLNGTPRAEIDEAMAFLYHDSDLSFQEVSPHSLKKEIEAQVLQRYRYSIDASWVSSTKHLQLLREVSLKLGLQLEVKDYRFTDDATKGTTEASLTSNGTSTKTISVNGQASSTSHKKKKKTRDGSPSSTHAAKPSPSLTFVPDDILNIVPVIKEASPRSLLAEEALEAGRISILQGQKKLGQELLLESLSLHEQIYGHLHPEVGRVYNALSMIYYQLEEKDAAIELAHKAVIVSERTLGVDNAETLLNYLNLGLFGHASGDNELALNCIKHALELWKVVYGPNHPDSITAINNGAVMLQHLKEYHESRLWFEASLRICEDAYGKHSINAATLLFQLAQSLALDQDSKTAVNRMRECYNIFLTELGANDKNTKEAERWLEQLTQNAVSIAKQAKDVEARKSRIGMKVSPRVTLGQTQPQPQVGKTAESTSGRDPLNVMGFDSRSIDELMKFIEGTDQNAKAKKRPGHSNPKRRGGATTLLN